MTRHEIRSRFDEIVAFAEVEKFLDTPVKRYSSGMYVRLAFAVAAHLERQCRSRRQGNLNSWRAALYDALAESDWYCDGGFRTGVHV